MLMPSLLGALNLDISFFQNVSWARLLVSAWAVFIVSILLYVLQKSFERRSRSKLLPGKKFRFLDVLGNSRDLPYGEGSRNGQPFTVLFMQVLEAYQKMFSQQGVYCFWITYIPFIVLTKAKAVEALISGTKVMEKNFSYNFLHPWLGTGLLTSHGSKWKSRRKLLTPSFHFDILKDFLPIFNEQSHTLVKKLQKETEKEFTSIVTPVTLCSLDIICETTLGVRIFAQDNSESEYVKAVSRAAEIIMERMVNCFQWPELLFRFSKIGRQLSKDIELLHSFTKTVIHEKKTKLLCGDASMASGRKRKALMDLLLEHHIQTKSLTEEDIREEVDTFAFEGHDTTSMGMSWALYLIGLHKDVQQKIVEELDSIFGDDKERHATTEDLSEMKYLDMVLKESQRLYPSVPTFAREPKQDINICGYPIPKGATCVVFAYFLHRDPEVFPNPEKFDPLRFLPENSVNRHPFAYVPFSAGPRNCIGQRFALMEEKVVISTILRNFTLHSLDERDSILPAAELILRPTNPLRIRIRPRHPKRT